MKVVFDIPGDPSKTDTVLCEWGEKHCCLASLDTESRTVHSLKYLTFETALDEAAIAHLIAEVKALQTPGSKTVFCSAFPEALLVPHRIYNPAVNYLSAVYETRSTVRTDRIAEWQLVNTYAFPLTLEGAIQQHFSAPVYYHTYTPDIKVYTGYDAADQVLVQVTPAQFRVIVKSRGQLQLAQTYPYTTPLDVAYYLLKIVTELALPKEETLVIISGLVEEASGLYKELHQYFMNLHFAKGGSYKLQADYPEHFFSSLYNLAECVS